MDEKRFRELSLLVEIQRYHRLGTERYMVELHAIAEELNISDEEMFLFCKEVFNNNLALQWKTRAKRLESELLNKPMDELEFSVRSYNCIKNARIRLVGDFLKKTDEEWLRTKNFGKKSLKEIREVIEEFRIQVEKG